mmetsp:Transcript_113471/g.316009  ORF Transcript_113471/g.316009 Transcript_113471/m.316009 type:complete len:468 (+) Transcript_113471:194-1597(+)|eukprot:CAMPEP_0179105624 /NCGR_PEP_ID=MMETSP0796-20121207/49064_1 /TAXON_ID=73915 /ORGANISM="Pyrodinium bahamense, Strain pbaha01" /LENGTH=467 /DNA_ID=CAMNT_0020803617 /DNA_START=194 /DNA_END=1600 /DNA_ORIENTATION=+
MTSRATFLAFYLCLVFVLLALWRSSSRAALGTRFRKWLYCHLPEWAGDTILFLGQWWAILSITLLVELAVTKASIGAVMDVTLGVRSDMQWLATFSRGAAPACLVTCFLCLLSVVWQVHQAWSDARAGQGGWHRGLKWVLPYPRDVVLQVLLMPAVYHLMMCRSLLHRWSALSEASATAEPGAGQQLQAVSEASSSLAEMYDAYALWCFGNLGMRVAARELRRQEELERSQVFAVLRGTLMFGVQAYVVTSVLGALYSIGLAFVRLHLRPSLCSAAPARHGPNATGAQEWQEQEQDSGWCTFTNVIYGADFATSTIAIYNLFSFEHQLRGPLEKFSPGLKFWSMKVPVTLSFSLIIILKLTQPITGLEADVLKLVDTISKAYFMVLVSLLNVFAWRPSEEWYCWPELCEDERDCKTSTDDAASSSSPAETASESESHEAEESEAYGAPCHANSQQTGAGSLRLLVME